MNSPELLLLVENCPKGAETLVTRCLHSLTDKGARGRGQAGARCLCPVPALGAGVVSRGCTRTPGFSSRPLCSGPGASP